MDENIIKQFGSLANFRSFLEEQIIEKINDGAEISRGKSPTETSKEEKKEKKISKEVKKNADGSGSEIHYDTSGEEVPPPESMSPPVDPTGQPGSQIAVGHKEVDDVEADPKAVPIKLSGKKEQLNMKPKITVKDDGLKR